MDTQLFCIYDSAAARYLEPWCAPTVEVAIRMFRQLVNKPEHQFNKFPEDYSLFHVGSFEGETGTLCPLTTPHSLGVAITFLDRKRPEIHTDAPTLTAEG